MADGLLRILLGLDAHEVNAARKDVAALSQDLDGLGKSEHSLGFERDAAILKQVSMDITRLANISRTGESKGGVLNLQQWKDAATLSKQIGTNLGSWVNQSQQLRAEMAQINSDLKGLQKASLDTNLSAKHRQMMLDEVDQLKARREEVGKGLKGRAKGDAHAEMMREKAGEYSGNISSYGTEAGNQIGSAIKKALGFGLAAAGGFSLLGFLAKSRGEYQQSVRHQVNLGARGIRGGFDAGVSLGMGPLEYMGLMENISSSTSMGGKHLRGATNLSVAFGRAYGMEPSQVGGMYGSMYSATGMESAGGTVLAMAVEKGIKKSQMKEAMLMVARNTDITAQAMNGAGAGDKAGGAIALALAAMKGFDPRTGAGQFYKSNEFMNIAQNGLAGGAGSPAGDIELFDIMGGFNGQWDWKKKFKYEQMKEGGFLKYPEMFADMVNRQQGTPEEKAAQLMTKYRKFGLTTSSALAMLDPKAQALLEEAKMTGQDFEGLSSSKDPKHKDLLARLQKQFGDMPGAGRMIQNASHEELLLKSGAKLNDAFLKLEKSVTKLADKFLGTKAVDIGANAIDKAGDWVLNNPKTAVAGGAGLWLAKKILGGAKNVFTHGGGESVTAAAGEGSLLSGLLKGGFKGLGKRAIGGVGADWIFADKTADDSGTMNLLNNASTGFYQRFAKMDKAMKNRYVEAYTDTYKKTGKSIKGEALDQAVEQRYHQADKGDSNSGYFEAMLVLLSQLVANTSNSGSVAPAPQ